MENKNESIIGAFELIIKDLQGQIARIKVKAEQDVFELEQKIELNKSVIEALKLKEGK